MNHCDSYPRMRLGGAFALLLASAAAAGPDGPGHAPLSPPVISVPDSSAPARMAAPWKVHPDSLRAAPRDTVAIGLPEVIGSADGVKDPVFAILVNLVARGIYGTLTGERLQQELDRQRKKSPLPYRTVRSVTRLPVRAGWTSRVTLDLLEPLDLPVPYSILGYHPGSFTTTQVCTFYEWRFARLQLVDASGSGDERRQRMIELEEVHIFALDEGEIWIDIDGFVDRILGGAIDDTRVTVLALGRYQGEWIGVASGYGREAKGRSGILSLQKDKILFPTPEELKPVGRQLRSKAESLARIWRAGEGGLGAPMGTEAGARP